MARYKYIDTNPQVEGTAKALAWVKSFARVGAGFAKKIVAAQAVAQEKSDALVAAIKVEAELRASAEKGFFATEVLGMRFDLPAQVNAKLPDLLTYVMPALRAEDKMRPTRRKLVVSAIASDTPDMLRAKRREAVSRFVKENDEMIARGKQKAGALLPSAVWEILTEAPVPVASVAKPTTDNDDDDDSAVIGTRPLAMDSVLAQAAAEVAALPRGVSHALAHVHRG
jgi:hypothetical protein